MTAGSEAVGLKHRYRLAKPPPDRSRIVGYLGQILPNDLGRWSLPVQVRHVREPLADRQTV